MIGKVVAALRFFRLAFSQGLHGGEQDDLTDGVGAGQQHDTAVDADAHAARGGHAVFHGVQEVLIQHFGLIVAARAAQPAS